MFKNPWDKRSDDERRADAQKEIRKIKESWKELKKSGKLPGLKIPDDLKDKWWGDLRILYVVVIILTLMWLSTGFFTIDADEEGIVMRFGKYNREVMPGLNYKLPTPFETVQKVSVTRIKKEMIGKITNPIKRFRVNPLSDDNQNEADLSYPKESQMLTGDENIIDMHFYVQWKISDPKDYLFNIKDSQNDNIVRSAAESIMREVIGAVSISEALSEGRLSIEQKVKKGLQEVLNLYGAGIEIISVGILYSYVGAEVRDAYRDVQSAKADRERFINQAQAYRNEIIPKAKGEAGAIIQSAMAYKESAVAKSEGDAQKFNEVYKAYSSSKEVTKRRMYLDTMEKIYQETDKVIIDKELSKGILPFLPLDKMNNINSK